VHTVPEDLERLRERNLGHNRSLAVREFAVGIEALERFVRKEPLYRVHECVSLSSPWRANPSIRGFDQDRSLARDKCRRPGLGWLANALQSSRT